MRWVGVLGALVAAIPIAAACRANRRTALAHAVAWAAAAWLAWLSAAVEEARTSAPHPALRYVALCVTGCAGVAVLGARRPGVAAWNFVVAGLLVVLLRPLWERVGPFRLEGPYLVFLSVVLAVGLINYVPTRLGLAAIVLGFACVLEALPATTGEGFGTELDSAGRLVLAMAAWLAWTATRWSGVDAFDALWLSCRDRFGWLWASRMLEQFNHAATHAGWAVRLTRRGLSVPAGAEVPPEALETLRAVLKRFGPEEPAGSARARES